MVAFKGKSGAPVVFIHSVIGQSHIKNNKPCQDASLSEKSKKYSLIAVADGHGGDPYFRSDVGSRLAVHAAQECMTNRPMLVTLKKSRTDKERETLILQLKKSIVGRWNALMQEHFEAAPFTEDELASIPDRDAAAYRAGEQAEKAYGSTLIAALWTDDFLLCLQIGDGNCVIVDDTGIFSQPIPGDERCFLNVTTSICDKDAVTVFRHFYTDTLPAAVVIGTDGVDDCFAGEEKLYNFYRLIMISFTEKDEDAAAAELTDYLPRMSEKGSGDDISIGMMFNKELLRWSNKCQVQCNKQET